MEKPIKDITDYETETFNLDELSGTDIRINPSLYLHWGLKGYWDSINDKDAKDKYIKCRLNIEFLEMCCKALKKLPDNYKELITEFINKKEYKDEASDTIKSMKLVNFKVEIILPIVFEETTATFKLKA